MIMDNLVVRLNKLSDNADDIMKDALQETAQLILADAKLIVPVDTGNLKRSLNIKEQGMTVDIGTNVEYAGFVEFGTYKMRAQPYLYPAYENNKRNIEKVLERKVEI